MPTVFYIHGFLSSPASYKAAATAAYLAANAPGFKFSCPALSSSPAADWSALERLWPSLPQPVGIIGSSLGGFYATALCERFGCRAALVNPAVSPHTRFSQFAGTVLQNYHSGSEVRLGDHDLAALAALEPAAIPAPDRYFLLLQTGDTTLDFRDALRRYPHSSSVVIGGGSHAFDHYITWLPDILRFLFTN